MSGAAIQYFPLKGGAIGSLSDPQTTVVSKDDGSFQIVVPAGKGHLLVFGPTSDYILDVIGSRTLSTGQPGGRRIYVAKDRPVRNERGRPAASGRRDPARGQSVRGRVVGPHGQMVQEAVMLSRALFWMSSGSRAARDGDFELDGLDPLNSVPVYFLDPVHEWGATIEVSGKQEGQDLTIRLQPCGQATARFVDAVGKPLVSTDLSRLYLFDILITPGPHYLTRNEMEQSQLGADFKFVGSFDQEHYANRVVTDPAGRVTFPDLIPGALYRIYDNSTTNVKVKGVQTRKNFTVKPGETLDLGDILIENPAKK